MVFIELWEICYGSKATKRLSSGDFGQSPSFSGEKTRWQNEALLKYRQTYLKEIPKRRVWVFIPLSLVSNGSEIW